jgi:enamine deaminase RidA (YjgF/YER057c/UK114 family)
LTAINKKLGNRWLEWLPSEILPTRATIGVNELGANTLIEVVVSAAQ